MANKNRGGNSQSNINLSPSMVNRILLWRSMPSIYPTQIQAKELVRQNIIQDCAISVSRNDAAFAHTTVMSFLHEETEDTLMGYLPGLKGVAEKDYPEEGDSMKLSALGINQNIAGTNKLLDPETGEVVNLSNMTLACYCRSLEAVWGFVPQVSTEEVPV